MAYNSSPNQLANLNPLQPGDPRRINKPVGAKTRQITRARRILEKASKPPEGYGVEQIDMEGEQITEADAVYLIQLAKAKLGDKDAAKFVMDYAGFKPSEHIEMESKDVDAFSSEEEELADNERWAAEALATINATDGLAEQANAIVNAPESHT